MLYKHLKLSLISFSLIIVSFNFSYSKIIIKQIEVKGDAPTYSDAIANALVQAVSQVKGVKISNQSSLSKRLSKIDYSAYYTKNSTTIATKSVAKKVTQITNGYVQSYKIKDSNKTDDKYEVKLLVDVAEYISEDESEKLALKKIAILPFVVNRDAISVQGISSSSISTSLQQGLVNQFTQSRKFRMVNRNIADNTAFQKEVAIISNSQTDSKDNAKLGNKTNADFILTGKVSSFTITNKKTNYYGEEFSKYSVSATVSYQLMDLTTMEIKWANTVTKTLPTTVANKYMDDHNGSYVGVENYLFKEFSQTIADQVIGVAYPLSVLKILDNDVYLNQGGDRVQRGSTYKIYEKGTVVKDQATGQLITVAGKNIGTIRISDVMPKYSLGQLISGNNVDIYPNDKAYLQARK